MALQGFHVRKHFTLSVFLHTSLFPGQSFRFVALQGFSYQTFQSFSPSLFPGQSFRFVALQGFQIICHTSLFPGQSFRFVALQRFQTSLSDLSYLTVSSHLGFQVSPSEVCHTSLFPDHIPLGLLHLKIWLTSRFQDSHSDLQYS